VAAPTLTVIADSNVVFGSKRTVQMTYTGNAAYTAGGDVPTVPLRLIAGMIMLGQNTASFGVIPIWNSQTGKIQLLDTLTAAEFSGNASTFTYQLLFIAQDD
jgi:prephenate dehydratase